MTTDPFGWLDGLDDEDIDDGDPDGLRYYQRRAFEDLLRVLEIHASALVVLPTGSGKSVLFSALAKHEKGRVLVLCHRDELVDQARGHLERMCGEFVEVEQGPLRIGNARLGVGMVQTITKRLNDMPKFDLVIVDEAHRMLAPTWRKAIEHFKTGGAKVVGFTATPDRHDGKALKQLFDVVAARQTITDGINEGYLVPITAKHVYIDAIDISHVKSSAGDLQAGELDDAVVNGVEAIVDQVIELEPDRQGIAYFPGVTSAEYAAAAFNRKIPGSAVCITGKTDPDLRKQFVADFKNGDVRYLCNVLVAVEGFDAPNTSLIIQARPTKSRALYAQAVGRGTRILPGLFEKAPGADQAAERRALIEASDKPECVILDFVGNVGKHKLVGPIDVLGGDFSPVEVKTAKKKMEEGEVDPMKALLDSREMIRAMARRVAAAKVQARVVAVDPFAGIGMSEGAARHADYQYGYTPMSPAQKDLLLSKGFTKEQIEGMGRAGFRRIMKKLDERREKGLATLKQTIQLQKYIPVPSDTTFAQAHAAMEYIARSVWNKEIPYSPDTLDRILTLPRQAGE